MCKLSISDGHPKVYIKINFSTHNIRVYFGKGSFWYLHTILKYGKV